MMIIIIYYMPEVVKKMSYSLYHGTKMLTEVTLTLRVKINFKTYSTSSQSHSIQIITMEFLKELFSLELMSS